MPDPRRDPHWGVYHHDGLVYLIVQDENREMVYFGQINPISAMQLASVLLIVALDAAGQLGLHAHPAKEREQIERILGDIDINLGEQC